MTATAATTSLTHEDTCARCGARALMRITFLSGVSLDFCGHHGTQHEAKARESGATIHDERLLDS